MSDLYPKLLSFTGYAIDSRLCKPGDLFFALPGEKTDGHKFLNQVAANGGKAAIVLRGYSGPDFGLELIEVDDPLQTLQKLAQDKLQKQRPLIVGVTGTVGKTTCKEYIATLLEGSREVAWSPKSQNSQLTCPLTILNQAGWGEEVLVLEMGMSKKGEIARLVEIASPDIAVITAVSLVHAANFDSWEEIACAKGEILQHPRTKLGVIPPIDLLRKFGSCPKKVVSFEHNRPELSHLPPHHQYNAFLAMTVCRELGLEWETILHRVPLLNVLEGRGSVVEKGGIVFIHDAYNASPQSMKAALDALPKTAGKKLAVLGDMKELGKFSEEAHKDIGNYALDKLDHLICTGEECVPLAEVWRKQGREVNWFGDNQGALQALKKIAKPGDTVLLKGSNSCRLWELLEAF